MRRFFLLFTVSLLYGLTGCETNPSTGRSQLLLVSASTTVQMGIEAKPQLIEEYGGEYPSEPLREYIDRVGRSLVNQVEPEYAEVEWEFFLLDSEVINAFALPGGKVFITVGLLSHFTNEAQVAGVLGHEIGHVTARHVDERISHSMFIQGLLVVADASLDSGFAVTLLGGAGQGYLLKFNRDQELEADRQGMKYMSRAQYDPIGMRLVLEVLAEESEGDRSLEILSTHPYPERRLRQIDDMLAGQYADTQGNPDFSTYELQFQRDAVPYFPERVATSGSRIMASGYCLLCRHPATDS